MERARRAGSIALLMSLVVTSTCLAQKPVSKTESSEVPTTGPTDPNLARLDRMMISFLKEHHAPGASLAVARHGRLVYARGFGLADKEKMEPVEPRALFRIASISKPITAVAVLQLVERQKLKLDDKVFDLLKIEPFEQPGAKFDSRWKQITVLQLLHHTGGFDSEKSFDPMFASFRIVKALSIAPPADQQAIIRYTMGLPLDFDPCKRFAYSNFGYCLLGRVIERASGQAYEDYVRKEVLAPLGIHSMRLGKTLSASRAKGEVGYYDEKNRTGPSVFASKRGQQVPLPYGSWNLEAMDSHGGWIASAPDLVRFATAFADPERCAILKPHSIAILFARPDGAAGLNKKGKPLGSYYACGWQVIPGKPEPTYWHAGALDGSSTLLVHRHDGFTWAVLFNQWKDLQGKELADEIDPIIHEAVDAVKKWPIKK
jgi:CubicO group peptidase (beta-lactamase class C family)